jgi:hypothetical protein
VHKNSGPVELGFMSAGAHVGPNLGPPIFSTDFHAIGVGAEYLPNGSLSIAIDVVGPPKPGLPWLRITPNLVGQVAGVRAPVCG